MSDTLMKLPVKNALLAMAAPAAIGMLMTFMFQLVDTYFIGQLGTKELAAISFSYPIYFLVVSFFMGLSSGISSTVGKALGENNAQKAKALTSLSLMLFMLLTIGLGFAGYFSIDSIFSLLGAREDTLPLIAEYMQTLYIGMFFLVGGLIGNSALMAKGIMVKSTVIMGIGGLINLILDYVLIFGMGPIPAMGLEGAALATVISWFIIFMLMTGLLTKENLFALNAIESTKKAIVSIREILIIGGPAVAAQILNPIAIAFITRLVANSGENAVAAYGIATRIESLGMTGILALSVILTPYVAQKYGAKNEAHLDQTIAYAGRMTVYWGLLFFAVILIFAGMIGTVFTDNSEVIAHTKTYLTILGISFPMFGLALITTSFFNGVYQPKISLKLTLVKTLGFTIPFALIGSLIGLDSVWIGLAIANIAGGLYAGKLLNKWMTKNNSSLIGHKIIDDYIGDMKYLLSKIVTKNKGKP